MRDETSMMRIFTADMLDTMAYIWTRSTISLIDIRHKYIDPKYPLQNYQLPSSTLMYACGGTALVKLNETGFSMERFGIFHSGKGTMLSIIPEDMVLESYMVFYKAETPPFFKRDLQRLLEQVNPFIQQFGYAPSNPVRLLDLFQQMMGNWSRTKEMNYFHAKNLFHQSMYEVYRDLEQEEAKYLQPDPVLLAKQYLDHHYMQPIMFQEIVDMLSISRGQLTRLFKKREGRSLQEYLTLKRLEKAQYYLLHTNATMKEIADGCGLVDELNVIRMFKRHFGMTPSEYRNKRIIPMHGLDIDSDFHYQYNETGLGKLVKLIGDGEFNMFGKVRSREMILAAGMSLMLLLSACASTAPVTNGGVSNQSTAQVQQVETAQNVESKGAETTAQTRTIATVMGDIEVPIDPQRVIVLYNIGDVLAFGITPIAVDKFPGQVYYEEIEHISERPSWDNPEGMLALEPDLIIIWGDSLYDSLKSVAPVIVAPDDLTERVTLLGQVFGKEDRAAELLADYNNKLHAAKEHIAELDIADQTFTVVEENNSSAEIILWYKSQAFNVIYSDLGLQPHPKFLKDFPDAEYPVVSMEVAGQYIGDYMFHVKKAEGDSISKTPVWNSFSAVQNGKVMELDLDMFFWSDIQSANAQLDVIMNGIEAAVQQAK